MGGDWRETKLTTGFGALRNVHLADQQLAESVAVLSATLCRLFLVMCRFAILHPESS